MLRSNIQTESSLNVVWMLGCAQTIAWASSYYLPAILATNASADTGVSTLFIYASFSVALVVSGVIGPLVGKVIDKEGGRAILCGSNIVFALGLIAFGLSHSAATVLLAWFVLGLAMGLGLYDAAFGTLTRIYLKDARKSITGITLIAGFASTIGWPLSGLVESNYGWRVTCFAWAFVHLVIALPLNAMLPSATKLQLPTKLENTAQKNKKTSRTLVLLACVFTAASFTSTAMASYLPKIIESTGLSTGVAITASMLLGPAQVLGRVIEYKYFHGYHPLLTARLAFIAHPIGLASMSLFAGTGALIFVLFHGMGTGILTITRGTLPHALFGSVGYASRQGWLTVPAKFTQAATPVLFGYALLSWGFNAVLLTAISSILGFMALYFIASLNAKESNLMKG